MSTFYDQDADEERDDATMAFRPEDIEDAYYGRGGGGGYGDGRVANAVPMVWGNDHWGDPAESGPGFVPGHYDSDPTPAEAYMPRRAHVSPRAHRERQLRAVVAVAIVALVLAVIALLVVPPKNHPARIKLNTVKPPPSTVTSLAPVTTLAPIAPGPPSPTPTSPATTVVPQPSSTAAPLPAADTSPFRTKNGGTASNTSGAAGVPVYYHGGGGPSGNKVPTVVDGVVMPYPGVAPTAAQIRAAGTIPYTAGAQDTSGINWAAIDALAGEGWGP